MKPVKPIKISLSGIGAVLLDPKAFTIQPASHEAGYMLGLGWRPTTESCVAQMRAGRRKALSVARELYPLIPVCSWTFLDHNGRTPTQGA